MYENKTIEEVCRQFECNGRTGLTQEEAGIRLEHYGKNMLREAKKKHWHRDLRNSSVIP